MAGFYTSEIRCTGLRLGFELQGLNGGCRTLAHVDMDSRHRMGKYGGYARLLGVSGDIGPAESGGRTGCDR